MILLIDNYDSFTYNLCDYIAQLGHECVVVRNDEKTIEEIDSISFDAAVISPGPKTPAQAGITMQFIEKYYRSKPILGICLGHQAIGEFFGWELTKAQQPVHGKTSVIEVQPNHFLFKGLPAQFEVMRYHSLVLQQNNISEIEAVAHTASSREVMALQHKTLPVTGLQFHPESILTPYGINIMQNWFETVLQHDTAL